jgi:lycopene cyclase domain-containing protein
MLPRAYLALEAEMKYTYLLLDLIFLAPVAFIIWKMPQPSKRQLLRSISTLLVLTAVFDNLLIAAHIVRYHDSLRLGLSIGLAPVEDFAYALAATVVLPYIWQKVAHHA